MLVSGCSLGFILLGDNISTENQEVTGDSEEVGVAITHFFIAVIISSCWGLSAIISRSELISSIRIIGSIIFISTVMSFFSTTGQTFLQEISNQANSKHRPSQWISIPYAILVFVGGTMPIGVLQLLQSITNYFPPGALLQVDNSVSYILFLALVIAVSASVLAPPAHFLNQLDEIYESRGTIIEERPEFTHFQSLVLTALVSSMSIAVICVGTYYLIQALSFVARYEFAMSMYPALLIVLAPLFIPLYFFAGGIYQLYRKAAGHILISELSAPFTQPLPYEPDAEVRVLNTDTPFIFAKQVGNQDIIAISDGMVQEINSQVSDELSSNPVLGALLAHEEAHVLNRDTVLASRLQLIALVTFTPKNMLYQLYNFQGREFDADDHAQKKVSPDALRDALDLIKDIESNRTYMLPGAAGAAAASTNWGVSAIKSFGILYGDFMLTEAHPDLDDRRERLPE
jgi:Zn-dependent protease with chaperone function